MTWNQLKPDDNLRDSYKQIRPAEFESYGENIACSKSGNRIIIGHPNYYNSEADVSSVGRVQIFDWNGLVWILSQQFIGSNPDDDFGKAVSISGDGNTIAYKGKLGINGAVYVKSYNLTTRVWEEISKIAPNTNTNPSESEDIGDSIKLNDSGDRIVIGSPSLTPPNCTHM